MMMSSHVKMVLVLVTMGMVLVSHSHDSCCDTNGDGDNDDAGDASCDYYGGHVLMLVLSIVRVLIGQYEVYNCDAMMVMMVVVVVMLTIALVVGVVLLLAMVMVMLEVSVVSDVSPRYTLGQRSWAWRGMAMRSFIANVART